MKDKTNDNRIASSGNMDQKRKKTLIIAVSAAVLLTVILLVVGVVAWFAPANSSADVDAKVTVFDIITQYSLDANDSETITYSDLADTVEMPIACENLKLQLKYSGESDAYIRVKLFESFEDSDGNLIASSEVSYTLAEGWKLHNDGYYYYTNIVEGNTEGVTVPFVTTAGISSPDVSYAEDSYFNLVAVSEAVQPDRFNAFFGFEPEALTTNQQ